MSGEWSSSHHLDSDKHPNDCSPQEIKIGVYFIALIWDLTGHIVGGLFVDDTDLIHIDMHDVETFVEAHS